MSTCHTGGERDKEAKGQPEHKKEKLQEVSQLTSNYRERHMGTIGRVCRSLGHRKSGGGRMVEDATTFFGSPEEEARKWQEDYERQQQPPQP
ncbi:MAG: hypothetical protein WCX61_01575 [Candidatus Peribacteraceae bacterium]